MCWRCFHICLFSNLRYIDKTTYFTLTIVVAIFGKKYGAFSLNFAASLWIMVLHLKWFFINKSKTDLNIIYLILVIDMKISSYFGEFFLSNQHIFKFYINNNLGSSHYDTSILVIPTTFTFK